MGKHKILPGAAGIIALTAALGFVDGNRESEPENVSRGRITLINAQAPATADSALPGVSMSGQPAYLVELSRGNVKAVVLIDAMSGKILSS